MPLMCHVLWCLLACCLLPLPPTSHPKHSAPYTDDSGQAATAALPDVCFKPFGTTCATQSILQFWQMNMTYYETGKDCS